MELEYYNLTLEYICINVSIRNFKVWKNLKNTHKLCDLNVLSF